jgi:hypothetical protein
MNQINEMVAAQQGHPPLYIFQSLYAKFALAFHLWIMKKETENSLVGVMWRCGPEKMRREGAP